MPNAVTDIGIPEELHSYFWEYDVARLRADADRATIMLRLMESGDQAAIRWLRAHYGDAALGEFLLQRRGRGLGLKRLRYWGLLLGLPRVTVTEWIAALRTNPWYSRTRR